MKISLETKNFSFFKVVSGTLLLGGALVSPLWFAGFALFAALVVGKAHALGAWLSMWRAGKINWKYVAWMCALTVIVTFWGIQAALPLLIFVTYLFFAIHFFFDEFDLQEEKHTMLNALSGGSPLLLILLYLVNDYYHLHIEEIIFYLLAALFLCIEMFFTKQINWFFLHTKILTLFILGTISIGIPANSILVIFLLYHYFFWFIYPVYKLHKYKREERDGLIMILLLLIAGSALASMGSLYDQELLEFSTRVFMIGTLIHIFSTAPFGYLFSLPRPKI